MASRYVKNIKAFPTRPVLVAGNFLANTSAGTGDVGRGYTAERKTTGHYRVQCDDKYNTVISAVGNFQAAEASGVHVEVSGVSTAGDGTGFRTAYRR